MSTTNIIKVLQRSSLTMMITLVCAVSYGQSLSTEGNDFWLGFMNNWPDNPPRPITLEIYISSDSVTSGVLTMPKNLSFAPISFNVVPGVTTRLQVPSTNMGAGSNNTEDKGIHITTKEDVSVYAMNKRQYSADMTGILPTYSLGNQYYVLSHWEDDNRNNNDNSNSEFVVVSISDGTKIEITPSVKTLGGNPADVPFTITLNEGQIYQVQARGDLSGTKLFGTNDQSNGCQSFALFAGNQYTKVGHCDTPNGHDHLYAQQYPLNTWGREFIVVSFDTRVGGDIVKVIASEDNTTVHLNSSTFTLNAGEYTSFSLTDVNTFTSDKPIAVGQFSKSMGCDNTLGDPFYILISPVEQMLKKITFAAPTIATVQNYSISIVMKTIDVPTIKFDGKNISAEFLVVPDDPAYSYARITSTAGNHTLIADGGFIAYVYGFGDNESFGYTAGASIQNLKIDIGITSSSGKKIPADSICLHDVVHFTPLVNGLDYFEWSFGDGSTNVSLGQVPVDHKYNKAGRYTFKLKASINNGSCITGREQTLVKTIVVVDPQSKILGPRSVCPNTNTVSYYADKKRPYVYQWKIKGGTITQNYGDSIVVDWGPTNANAYVKLLSKNKFDCYGDTLTLPVKINIQLAPDAPLGPDTLCSSAMTNIGYYTFPIINSQFTWAAQPGTINSGQGSSSVSASWPNYGVNKIWFQQHAITNTDVCDGTSDTLYVFVQRDPSPDATILSNKNQFQIGEPVQLNVTNVDTLYQEMNWKFGDNTHLDTVAIQGTIHQFKCSGIFDISVNIYDTLGICPTKAQAMKPIEVLPVSFEIIQVSTLQSNDSILQILWKMTNTDFLTEPLKLNRRHGSGEWELVNTFDNQTTSALDTKVKTTAEIFEYELAQTSTCPDQNATDPQHNILLRATSDDNLSAQLSWNEYDNWTNGVDSYEIYLSKDKGDFILHGNTQTTVFDYNYDSLGFNYCFRIKALENGGNNAFSWSNSACVSFVPPVETYNVITPNNDGYNDYFKVKGIEYYPGNTLLIYNRWGYKVKEFKGYKNSWPYGGELDNLTSGVYFFVLQLHDPRAKQEIIKGPLSIIR